MLGKKHSVETKKKLSDLAKNRKCLVSGWNKGIKMSKEFSDKISNSSKGRVVSEETKKKISQKLKGIKRKPMTEEHRKNISNSKKGKPSFFKGKTHKEETIKKMSDKKIGIKRSKESIDKQIEKRKLIWKIKSPNGDILNFLGYSSFKEYVIKNNINVSITTLKSYGKNKGWSIIEKTKK
jgi:hypothetical protein